MNNKETMNNKIIRDCEECGKEDSINPISGLCWDCDEKEDRIAEIKEELERIENLSDYDNDEYNDYLDDVMDGEQLIKDYTASRILEAVDEISYNMGRMDYYGNKTYELEGELNKLKEK